MPTHACSPRRLAVLFTLLLALFGSLSLTSARPAEASTLGSRAVTIASYQKGDPYLWGAVGPDKFDCSGLTKYVYGRLGKYLPHNSTSQYSTTYVTRISKSSKAPGDLIFMRNSSGSITHVGLYAGYGKWWVAPKAGDVVKLQTIYSTNYSVGRVK